MIRKWQSMSIAGQKSNRQIIFCCIGSSHFKHSAGSIRACDSHAALRYGKRGAARACPHIKRSDRMWIAEKIQQNALLHLENQLADLSAKTRIIKMLGGLSISINAVTIMRIIF